MGRLTSIVQGTPEWFAARSGMATASDFHRLMVRDKSLKDDSFGKTADEYALELAAERMGGEDEQFTSMAMARGSALESDALDAYEDVKFNALELHRGRFYVMDTLAVGASPDGEVLDNGLRGTVEVKCMNRAKHARVWLYGMPEEHRVQVQGTMWVTDAQFCDFVSYHPSVRADRQLCVVRVLRDAEFIATLSLRTLHFMRKVDAYADRLGCGDWQPITGEIISPPR